MGNFVMSETKKALPKQSLYDIFEVTNCDLKDYLSFERMSFGFCCI